MVEIEFFDPSGTLEITQRHAPRLSTLSGKRIGVLSNDQWQAHRTLPMLKALFEADFPGIDILPIDTFPRGNAVLGEASTIRQVRESGVDAVVIGNAACGSCSTALGRAAAKLESENIPTVLLARQDFVGVVKNAVSGLGFAPETAMVPFPVDTFLPDSDLSAVASRKQEFYDGLTRWQALSAQSGTGAAPMLKAQGRTYEEALAQANHLLLTNLWGDGLPLWPATRERVDLLLRGTDLPRTLVLGKFMPRGAIVTVESCAIALAMAGGRPEYLPILVAAVEAFLDPESDSEHLQAESHSVFPVVIVNGPMARQIRLSSTFGCLGPDPQRPAGASIGRALRLMQQNLGGAIAGIGAMATWGAMRFTNAVFAEDEEGMPAEWQTHGAERHGYAQGTNSVSLVFCTGVANIRRRGVKKETLAEDALHGMHRMADYMRSPNLSCLAGWRHGTQGVLMISPIVARTMASLGWTKQSMREFLWEHSKIPGEHLRRAGSDAWIEVNPDPEVKASVALDPWPLSSRPDNLVLLVSGGEHPTNSYWMEAYCPQVIGRVVHLPKAFDDLLRQADRDIGCGADACLI